MWQGRDVRNENDGYAYPMRPSDDDDSARLADRNNGGLERAGYLKISRAAECWLASSLVHAHV